RSSLCGQAQLERSECCQCKGRPREILKTTLSWYLKYRSTDAICVYPQANWRIGSCLERIVRENTHSQFFGRVIQRSSVVERSAVNRLVVGSNPTAGANFSCYGARSVEARFLGRISFIQLSRQRRANGENKFRRNSCNF